MVNSEIRSLWARAGDGLSPEAEDRYRRLLVEWAAAIQADIVEAA
ncbi:MAG TPA: hypothetical protein VFH94_06615 [Streptomyces sp.]|nr:hypothetical protein [Streptomyces sp.]